jgi:hypothetical protein
MSATADIPDSITVEITHDEAFGPLNPHELDDDEREMWVDLEADIQTSEALREIALDQLDEDDIPEASHLLWVDEAEVYPLCLPCYEQKADAAWTGGTKHPHHDRLRQTMREKLAAGTSCSDCKHDRVEELKADLNDQIDVEVTLVDG